MNKGKHVCQNLSMERKNIQSDVVNPVECSHVPNGYSGFVNCKIGLQKFVTYYSLMGLGIFGLFDVLVNCSHHSLNAFTDCMTGCSQI